MLAIASPITQFFDLDGTGLDHGRLYFGPVGGNPETTPILIYWDAAGTIPAAQPVKTLNGFTVRNGSPAQVFVPSNYSITVRNKRGALVVYAADSTEFSNADQILARLADDSDPDNGAGMVGYDSSTVYLPGTVGYALNNSASGASQFGINVFDAGYIPLSEQAAIRAGTSTYDCHDDIQQALNDASNSWTRKVFFPAGRYHIPGAKSLRTYYDATDNPGYNQLRNAHIELIGEGIDSESSGTATPGDLCGSLLWSPPGTVRSAPILIVSPSAMDGAPYYGRDFVMRDMSVDGNRASHLVVCLGVPGARFEDCSIILRNVDGSGLQWGSGYFGGLHNLRIQNYAVGTKTGDSVTLSTTIPAGLLVVDKTCNFSGCAFGIRVVSGTVQQLKVESSQITGTTGHIYVQGTAGVASVEMLEVIGTYAEGVCQYWIKGTSESIRVMKVGPGFVYGAGFTQAAIQVDKVDAIDIGALRVQDLAGAFMDVASLASGSHAAYRVANMHFNYSGTVVGSRTLFTGVLPEFGSIEYPEANPLVVLHSASKFPIRSFPIFSADASAYKAGHVFQTHEATISPAVAATTYYHAALGYPAITIFATSAGASIFELKKGSTAKLGNMFPLDIINRGAGTITVIREIGGTTITTVAANSKTKLFWSDSFDDWL